MKQTSKFRDSQLLKALIPFLFRSYFFRSNRSQLKYFFLSRIFYPLFFLPFVTSQIFLENPPQLNQEENSLSNFFRT